MRGFDKLGQDWATGAGYAVAIALFLLVFFVPAYLLSGFAASLLGQPEWRSMDWALASALIWGPLAVGLGVRSMARAEARQNREAAAD